MGPLTGIELTAPALFLAGLAVSPHCMLMCGGVAAAAVQRPGGLSPRQTALWVHGGRLLGYAALGAVAGMAGAVLLRGLPSLLLGDALRLLAAGALLVIGLLQWRVAAQPDCRAPAASAARTRSGLLLRGMLWSLLPCAVLYAVLALAVLSARPVSGALLAGAFGAGTLPLLLSGSVLAGLLTGFGAQRLRRAGGSVLAGLGALTVVAVLYPQSGLVLPWCAPA
jgi:uncharacterized protein